jgi:histidinol-phosphatase
MMAPPSGSPRMQFAHDVVAGTRDWLLDWFHAGIEVHTKADRTPVTEADVAVEKHIATALAERFPDDAFYGEETGRSGEGDWLWLLDPIDGTRSFARGYGYFSTQLAAMYQGQLRLGVSQAPVAGERLWAETGAGAWEGTRRLVVSEISRLDQAHLSLGNIASLARDPGAWGRVSGLLLACERHRGYGDYLHYHLLARGQIDIIVESDINILDVAALTVILQEAGATVSDLAGNPIGLASTSLVAANPALHQQVIDRLSAGNPKEAR